MYSTDTILAMFGVEEDDDIDEKDGDEGFDLATTPAANMGDPLSGCFDDEDRPIHSIENLKFDGASTELDSEYMSELKLQDELTISNEHIKQFIQSDFYKDLRRSYNG